MIWDVTKLVASLKTVWDKVNSDYRVAVGCGFVLGFISSCVVS